MKDRQAAQTQADAAAERFAAAATNLADAERVLAETEARAAENLARTTSLEAEVKQVAVQSYVHGGVSVPMIFDADLGKLARRQALASFVSGGKVDTVDEYRAARKDLVAGAAAVEESLSDRKEAAAKLAREQEAAQVELGRLAKAEERYLAKVAAGKAAAEKAAAVKRLMAAGLSASKAAAAAQAQSTPAPGAAQPAGVIASGAWICPVQGTRAFTNDWGQPRSGGRRHQGTDILSPKGTPIVANVSGSVRDLNAGLGGLSYYLTGDDGNTYFGTHLSAYGAVGRVSAGTVIGYVGDSGNAKGTFHLHFEVHPGGGGPVNPYPLVSRNC